MGARGQSGSGVGRERKKEEKEERGKCGGDDDCLERASDMFRVWWLSAG